MTLHVECYSGPMAEARPVRFQVNGHDYFVDEVVDQWYGRDGAYFKLRTDNGDLYVLRREMNPEGSWTLEAYRQGKSATSGFSL